MFCVVALIVFITSQQLVVPSAGLADAKEDDLRTHSERLANPPIPPRSKQPFGPGPPRGVRSRFKSIAATDKRQLNTDL